MKRISPFIAFLLLCLTTMAQPRHNAHPAPQPAPHHGMHATLTLSAQTSEEFVVYVDGNLYSRRPTRREVLQNLPAGSHDIFVRLTRPADKIAYITFDSRHGNAEYKVHHHSHGQNLTLDPFGNMPPAPVPPAPMPQHQPQPHANPAAVPHGNHQPAPHATPAAVPPAKRPAIVATGHEVAAMVDQLTRESFDNNRLDLAKTMVDNKMLTTDQVISLARTITFASTQLDFLKYAYHRCADPENYYRAASILKYSSDRETLLEYIKH